MYLHIHHYPIITNRRHKIVATSPAFNHNPNVIQHLKQAFQRNTFEKRIIDGEDLLDMVEERWGKPLNIDMTVRGNSWYLIITNITKPKQVDYEKVDSIAKKLTEWYMIENVEQEMEMYKGCAPNPCSPVMIRVCKCDPEIRYNTESKSNEIPGD